MVALPGQHLPQIVARRHKAHICSGEEQHQPHIGIGKAHRNAAQRAFVQPQGHGLEHPEHDHDGQQRGSNFLDVLRQPLMEQLPQLHRIAHLRQHRRDVGAVGRAKCDAEDQHRQNGAH